MPVSRSLNNFFPMSAVAQLFQIYNLFLINLVLQIAPLYLTSCIKQGLGLLENLLYKQPVQHHQVLLKVMDPFFLSESWLSLLSVKKPFVHIHF